MLPSQQTSAADQSAPVQLTIPLNKLPCNDDKRGKVNKKPHVKLTWRSFVTFGTLIWHPQFVPITLNEALEFLRYHFETGLRHFATQTARKMAKMSLGVRRMSVFCYFCESNFGQAQFLEYRLKLAKNL